MLKEKNGKGNRGDETFWLIARKRKKVGEKKVLGKATIYNQLPEESYEDWKYRIILGKARKEVDMSWQEICNMLCLGCKSEHLRKIASGVLKYDTYLKSRQPVGDESTANNNRLSELEEKEIELRKEKMRLQDQKRELSKKIREWARAEHLQQEIISAIKDASKTTPHFKKHTAVKQSEYEAALLLSDWHIGMRTNNAVNTFNDAVLHERIDILINETLVACHTHYIQKIHLFSLGDLVNGLIHVTTRINNEENVIKQCMLAAEIICKMLLTLSEELDVELYWSRGNHDRITANKKESICSESFADLILWYVQARVEDIENIKIHENDMDDEIIVTEILGNKIFAVHGHKDKPSKVVQNLSLLLKEFPDYIFMGHYHANAEVEIQGAEVIVNGSLCGTDDYAMSLRRSSHPAQKLLIFNKKGRKCTYDIRLD